MNVDTSSITICPIFCGELMLRFRTAELFFSLSLVWCIWQSQIDTHVIRSHKQLINLPMMNKCTSIDLTHWFRLSWAKPGYYKIENICRILGIVGVCETCATLNRKSQYILSIQGENSYLHGPFRINELISVWLLMPILVCIFSLSMFRLFSICSRRTTSISISHSAFISNKWHCLCIRSSLLLSN